MAVEIKVPSVGESITEGTLSRWLKPNGAAVRANEPVCELETDKATQEIVAPAAGTLAIGVPEGQKVAIGTVVGRIEQGPAPAQPKAQAQPKAPPQAKAPAAGPDTNSAPASRPASAPAPQPRREGDAQPSGRESPLSPAARQLAADQGIEPNQV